MAFDAGLSPAAAWSRRRGAAGPVFAALDLGTHNCRLLIARPASGGFRVIDAFSRSVRLGEGLAASGRLSEAAIARTLEALRLCAGKMRRRGVTRLRAVATEACRRAANGQDFIARSEREAGVRLEVIGAREEMELALLGCAPLLDPVVPHALVFDIGGGSTEVAWLDSGGTRALASLPFGVVSLAERHGGALGEAAGFRRVVDEINDALAVFRAETRLDPRIAAGELQMLGTSGTVTTLTGIHLGLPRYDRSRVDGALLDFRSIEEVTRQILAMPPARRASHPCIGAARADLVAAGCAILQAICRSWPVGRLRVADRGLREGLLLTMMARGERPWTAPPGSWPMAAP